jgi:hypothetical protein
MSAKMMHISMQNGEVDSKNTPRLKKLTTEGGIESNLRSEETKRSIVSSVAHMSKMEEVTKFIAMKKAVVFEIETAITLKILTNRRRNARS